MGAMVFETIHVLEKSSVFRARISRLWMFGSLGAWMVQEVEQMKSLFYG